MMKKSNRPNYKLIYLDIIEYKFPFKKKLCKEFFKKKELSFLDVIEINKIIFAKSDLNDLQFNQRYRSYDVDTIFKILQYQKENGFTNVQVASKFNMSRNTITSWKKKYF